MVVERQGQARDVLGPHFPLPIFPDWNEALLFVQSNLDAPRQLDQWQVQVQDWWQCRKATLAFQLQQDLMHPWRYDHHPEFVLTLYATAAHSSKFSWAVSPACSLPSAAGS